MNEETKKRMEEQAEKHRDGIAKLDGIIGEKTPPLIAYYKFIAGYTAAHNDAQGEIEKLKAELTEAKEKRLSSVRNDLRAEIEKLQSQLTAERAASAELLKALEMYFRIENSEHEVEVDVLTKDFERLAKKLLAAHNARQKERG